jgi:CubicO group peptidase (beta-lactamase class C family)
MAWWLCYRMNTALQAASVLLVGMAAACASHTSATRDTSLGAPGREDASLSRRIDSTVRTMLETRTIPGAAVAVLNRDTVIHVAGYGVADLSARTPVTPRTIFQIASLTKPFTAIATLLLVEEGRLKLDEAASSYLPELPPAYRTITIRQLLTHTSGISPDMRRANVDEMDLPEFWKRLSERPVSFQPGASFQYANAGYAILSFVVERVSGSEFGDFLQRRIFVPLGMSSSAYRVPRSTDGRQATGYDLVNGRNVEAPHVFSGWGNSGIETTIEDLTRFAVAIDRRDLLSSTTWALIFSSGTLATGAPATFTFADARTHYGLGWFLTTYKGKTLHTHGGAIAGFSSIFNRFPDDGYTVIVLSNGKQGIDRLGQADAIARSIAALIAL